MSNKDKLYKLAEEVGANVFEAVCLGLLPPEKWEPVLLTGSDVPYMIVSKELGGMVMVARWASPKALTPLAEEDMVDLVVGADGRNTN